MRKLVYIKGIQKSHKKYAVQLFPKALLYDNTCVESFHSLIKREWLNRFKIRDYKQTYGLFFEYIETFYNTKRIHSHYDYEALYQKLPKNKLLITGYDEEKSHFNLY